MKFRLYPNVHPFDNENAEGFVRMTKEERDGYIVAGQLQIYDDQYGFWRFVSRHLFTRVAGEAIVCNSLGMNVADDVISKYVLAPTNAHPLFEEVNCSGNESSIDECPRKVEETSNGVPIPTVYIQCQGNYSLTGSHKLEVQFCEILTRLFSECMNFEPLCTPES